MHTQKLPVAIAATLLTIALAAMAQAGQVQLSWNAPTTNEDGTPLTDLAGYMLYYGRTSRSVSGTYEFSLDVGNQTTFTLPGLQDGQLYYFSVTAYDTSANESAFSNEVSAVPTSNPPPPAGLVAAYSFDEGKGTTVADASGNGNTGTLKNGPTWTAGKYGSALSFDGVNDYVVVPNSTSLNISGKQITISLWVNITDRGGPDMVLLGKPWFSGSMTYPYYQYGIEFDANGAKTIDFYFGDTTGTLRGPYSVKPSVGVWTHVAFTYDGTNVKGYRNGVQQLSVPATQSIQARGKSLLLGVDAAIGQAFQGKIDQVRIYKRALTASEIQTDMNTPIK
jgi:hypothetical protein